MNNKVPHHFRFDFNEYGVFFQVSFPDWIKVLVLKSKGFCAKEHSQIEGVYCLHKRNHIDKCGIEHYDWE